MAAAATAATAATATTAAAVASRKSKRTSPRNSHDAQGDEAGTEQKAKHPRSPTANLYVEEYDRSAVCVTGPHAETGNVPARAVIFMRDDPEQMVLFERDMDNQHHDEQRRFHIAVSSMHGLAAAKRLTESKQLSKRSIILAASSEELMICAASALNCFTPEQSKSGDYDWYYSPASDYSERCNVSAMARAICGRDVVKVVEFTDSVATEQSMWGVNAFLGKKAAELRDEYGDGGESSGDEEEDDNEEEEAE